MTLLGLEWWCVACLTLQLFLLIAAALCPVNWRAFAIPAGLAALLTAVLVWSGYDTNRYDSNASHASATNAGGLSFAGEGHCHPHCRQKWSQMSQKH